MSFSRRKLFQYGFGGSLMLALGGIGLSLQSTLLQQPPSPLSVLSQREYSIIYALANRFLPENGRFPAAHKLKVAWNFDQTLATAHPSLQTEIKLLLALIENGAAGLLLSGNHRPFTQCSAAEQDAILEAWRTSSLAFRRSAILSINRLCGAIYYSSPESFELVGYGGPPRHLILAQSTMSDIQ